MEAVQMPIFVSMDKPSHFRALCRDSTFKSQTSGQCTGYVQANLVILPKEFAEAFSEFCAKNPKPCPLLEMSEVGSKELPKMCPDGTDISRDVPKYKVFRHGVFEEERFDVSDLYTQDMVSFILGCSFSFEEALIKEGLPVRHIQEGKNVPMYKTNIECEAAGPFRGCMVVSMRPYKLDQVGIAEATTAKFPRVHGAPIYSGLEYFEKLGIADINKPDYGEAVTIEKDEVPVFWACGVTPQNVLLSATEIPLVITHSPGCMLVTDVLNESLKS